VIVAAFDEGPGIGLGHRRRVESLQRELVALGVATDLRAVGDTLIEGDVVLVDSYRIRADDPERVRAGRIVAIDDIDRDLAVDLVVNPCPGANAPMHHAATRVLTGGAYALVSAHLRSFAVMPVRQVVRRVLVATGASDAEGIGARIASELAHALPEANVRLVVGEWGGAAEDERVEMLIAPEGLAEELVAADLVVTAGGVTMLEALCVGRPTVAFSIAANQEEPVRGSAAAGAVFATDVATAAVDAARLANDYGARRRLAASARALIDGRGSVRAAAAIESIARQKLRAG
jgi:UDP-2,4-diacetamido-2,4,6-trideoxy-beta-L-altropyranose hydrolase